MKSKLKNYLGILILIGFLTSCDSTKTCDSCNGTGERTSIQSCSNCGGDGEAKCNYSFSRKEYSDWASELAGMDYTANYKCKNGEMKAKSYSKLNGSTCSNCDGTGKVECDRCDGSGKYRDYSNCSNCGGDGRKSTTWGRIFN